MARPRFSLMILAALSAAPAVADTVYKSVDDQGNVTYSAEPPKASEAKRVEEIRVGDGPSEEEQAEALQRMREMELTVERLEQERMLEAQAQDAAVAAARAELEEAQAALEQAREMSPDDWQRIVTGGRTPKPSYFERVDRAEQRVQAAEQALREVR